MYDHAKDENDKSVSLFDPADEMEWCWREYEEIAKERLCPVGIGDGGYITYFISESGKLFGGCDDYLWKFGDAIPKALKPYSWARMRRNCQAGDEYRQGNRSK
jgi:hypothetical protein